MHFYDMQFDLLKFVNSLTYNYKKLKFRVYAW